MKDQIEKLRQYMKEQGVTWFYCKDGDPHNSEYVANHYKVRTYLSGFTGSNGNLLVGEKDAYLWTDGRYFVQAEKELKGTDFMLMRMGQKDVPTFIEFLTKNLCRGDVLGYDGTIFSNLFGKEVRKVLDEKECSLKEDFSIPESIWPLRPLLPTNPVWILEEKYSGESIEKKLERVREEVRKEKAEYHFISKLDDIMWITNLRGNDIECNPVAYSYLFLSMNGCDLFMHEEALCDDVKQYLRDAGVTLHPYEMVTKFLEGLPEDKEKKVLISSAGTSSLFAYLLGEKYTVCEGDNPSEMMKAVKNTVEIENLKEAYLLDSVVVTKYIKYVKERACADGITECEAALILDNMRRDIPGFIELSFPTIAAFGPNAAMMHYEAKEGEDAKLQENGIFLVDSGGHYYKGTTDVTRSIVLGEISAEMKNGYTRAVRGNLNLLHAVFLEGCTGRNLDILARLPLWEDFEDYKCGTGHGIGQVLNVHEGPQNISWGKRAGAMEAPLKAGMIVSDEPGIYKSDQYGVRIETILLCIKLTENEQGVYLGFEPVTLVPIDLDGIDISIMSDKEIQYLNDYHKLVYEKIATFLDEEEKNWLRDVTRPLTR